MRTVHRIISFFVLFVTLYLGVTGTLIQGIDLRTLFRHASPTDPEMMAIREGHDGPEGYAVIDTGDYSAAALPDSFDLRAAVPLLVEAAHATLGDAPLGYAEVRMLDGQAVGLISSGEQLVKLDFASHRATLEKSAPRQSRPPSSLRNQVKWLHRMTPFGNWALWINPLVGVSLLVFVVTGLVLYLQLLSARRRIRRPAWFWSAGGWWRSVHRWISLVASLFILVIALSGAWLAIESLVFGYYLTAHLPKPGQPFERPSGATPLTDAQLPGMLTTTLAARKSEFPGQVLKVVRLRIYGGMPQGVVVVGRGNDTQQLVFNARTGRPVSETEPGYPETGFPFGWQAHQWAKQIHRGDMLGLTGRWMDLIGGLAITYLSISAAVMYYDMWQRRRRAGRRGLLWT